jgi:hypothetical protein
MSEATMRYGTRPRVSRRSAHALREGITVGLIGQAVTPAIFLAGHVLGFVSMVGALAYFHGRLLRRMPEALDGE